jgi:hypothetical protein
MNLRLAFAMAGLLLALGAAVAAGGAVLDPAALEQTLEPSQAPGLLGPITAEGRVGWKCAPELASSATLVHDADLPQAFRER